MQADTSLYSSPWRYSVLLVTFFLPLFTPSQGSSGDPGSSYSMYGGARGAIVRLSVPEQGRNGKYTFPTSEQVITGVFSPVGAQAPAQGNFIQVRLFIKNYFS